MGRNFSQVKRIVVKVGTNLLSGPEGIDETRIEDIVRQIMELEKSGYQILLVSSGAIGMGAKEIGLSHSISQVAMRQACASIGQPILMHAYRRAFKKFGGICSQVLLTRKELDNRTTYNNLRNSVFTLLDLGVIPIFNENDVVSTSEIGSAFGDNDRMSAFVASKIDAQLLVILTDVDGLYDENPKLTDAKLLKEIDQVTDKVFSYAGGAGSAFATGGMRTKLLAARIASVAGCQSLIASGYEKDILPRLLAGEEIGTCIHAVEKLKQRQRWILNNNHSGAITVDAGAKDALVNHNSLLPKGIIAVEGVFNAGDVVEIRDEGGVAFAKAVPYYDSTDIAAISGHRSDEISKLLGPGNKDVVFRPEDMVFLHESDE
ncbi:MAG: glutamate 5-kinase [Spirochaetia bacterium]|nr:glutamate 5-kinase [Spirochaetia bacterium]